MDWTLGSLPLSGRAASKDPCFSIHLKPICTKKKFINVINSFPKVKLFLEKIKLTNKIEVFYENYEMRLLYFPEYSCLNMDSIQ